MSVPHALLALLSEGPKHGLRLQNEFESRTGEVWPLNVGQVYTTLQRLERDGLVETDDGKGERAQKRFRLTGAGAHELQNWLRTPPELVPPPRDVLVIKVLIEAAVEEVELALVVDAELFRLEAMVRWLDAADVRLKQLPLDPAAESAELPLEQPRKVEVSL